VRGVGAAGARNHQARQRSRKTEQQDVKEGSLDVVADHLTYPPVASPVSEL
jgi:hypothetical protein